MSVNRDETIRMLAKYGIETLVGVISTGSGQAFSLDHLNTWLELPYINIPGLEDYGLAGHEGVLKIVEGTEGNWAIWIGRRHFYQGYTHNEIGFYLDISSALGADEFICINAAGGLDPTLQVGNLVIIEKYRCFIPIPGITMTIDGGPWRETSENLREKMIRAAEESSIAVSLANYVGVPGPTYETAKEVEWLLSLGCQVVGMSTVPELIRAAELGMEAVVISAVANVHGSDSVLSHDEVVKEGKLSSTKIERIIEKLICPD